ncbi:MAG: hypothetical protein COA49_01715 [Bacteroidetes bacterium]|nr:MAG: hypothetical protein COA49_01715 [Bacteroidota bacterium]
MNKLSILSLAILITCESASSFAQTIVTSDNLPQPGSSYLIQTSTADITGDYVSTGADYLWDFSMLDSNSETLVEFGSLNDAPNIAQLSFNNSWTNPDYFCDVFGPGEFDLEFLTELGIDLPVSISNMLSYYQTSSSSFNLAGISINIEGFDVPVQYSDIDEIHPLPLHFDDIISSTSAYELDVPNTFNYTTSSTREGSVDGWGTLLLPNGATHDVLRINTTITTHDIFTQEGSDPFEIDRIHTVYTWVGDGGLPYLKVKTIFGVTFSVEYQGEAPSVDTSNTDGITAITPNTFRPFPNPAAIGEDIRLGGADSNSKWEVRDSAGRIIKTGSGTTISSDGLKPGTYLISNTSIKGKLSKPVVFVII